MNTKWAFSLMLLCFLVGSTGCVARLWWHSDPPWLTPSMTEGELAKELASNIQLGASREEVLKNLRRRGVKPLSKIGKDGETYSGDFIAAEGLQDPQFRSTSEYVYPYLNHNYYIESQNRIAILVVAYRAKPPWNVMVSWAESYGSEVIIDFGETGVHSVLMRPLDTERSRKESPQLRIENLR